jgi:hypothetical protein
MLFSAGIQCLHGAGRQPSSTSLTDPLPKLPRKDVAGAVLQLENDSLPPWWENHVQCFELRGLVLRWWLFRIRQQDSSQHPYKRPPRSPPALPKHQ